MDQVQDNSCLPDDCPTVDRRRGGFIGRTQRIVIAVVRSRWLAMFAIAFAVSWSFHQVDEIGQHRLERQQRITRCVIEGVATAQTNAVPLGQRVEVEPILQVCTKQVGK
jgi:hypothetical protein